MSGQDQRCGTCKWFGPIDGCAPWGTCGVPVADCFDAEDKAEMHELKAGTKCPCWAPIENGETRA